MNKREVGTLGEDLARAYLESLGYLYVDRNLYLSRGEIDLVMVKESCLYFIEVKYRRSMKFGSPREAMTSAKIRHLKSAVSEYLYKKGQYGCSYKLSFIGIHHDKGALKYDWLENIF